MIFYTISPILTTILLVTGKVADASLGAFHRQPPINEPAHPHNSTHTFKPCPGPRIDRKSPKNLVPTKNVSMSYAPEAEDEQGSINMGLVFNQPAVVLEHVESVSNVLCDDDTMTIIFKTEGGFDEAVKDWDIDSPFVLITGSYNDGCTAEFERGFFVVEDVLPDAEKLTVMVKATKGELPDLAGELEMSFTSLPAAALTRRLDLDPKYAISFNEGLTKGTTIFSDGKNVDITAEEAWFSSTVTFSGRLKYNFWTATLEELYFDLGADFEASAVISADIDVAFQTGFLYQPAEFSYSLVDVPGIIALGPGVAFGLSVEIEASAKMGLLTGVDVLLPAGRVHLDFLDSDNTETSGWEPEYDSFTNVTGAAEVQLDIGPAVTVALQFKLLGGLLDLTSGIRAVPGFANNFKPRGAKEIGTDEIEVDVLDEGMSEDGIACTDNAHAFEYASDFFFRVTAFATQWWEKELYEVVVPVAKYCVPL